MNRKAKPRAFVVTVSDSASRGEREDLSGPAVRHELENLSCIVLEILLVPDEVEKIKECLIDCCNLQDIHLVVTTGGTGLSPRDVTPQATATVIEREVPGMAELMRIEGMKHTKKAALSRALVGIRGDTLIINLPGSVKGVKESLSSLQTVLPHALEVISGNSIRCGD